MHLPSVPPLRRAVFAALSAVVMSSLMAGSWDPVAAAPLSTDPAVAVPHVKIGLGCWESGGRYNLTNPVSGAYGKYQIMPANWPSWANKYVGRANAKPTPQNQETVASGKLADLYAWLKKWERVAYWWLTGDTNANQQQWSVVAQRYVAGVLSIARRSFTASGRRTIPASCFSKPPQGSNDPGDQQPPGQSTRRTVVAAILNVRSGPGLNYRVIDGLHAGRTVTVLAHTHDAQGHVWIKVSRPSGGTGWVAQWWTRLAGSSGTP
jgi:hypothetical protein